MDKRSEASRAIDVAKQELDYALARLAELPTIDADRLTYTAHALSNYLMVVATISHILRRTITNAGDPEMVDRFAALDHATALMKSTVSQLIFPIDDIRPKLIFMPLDLDRVVMAACDEYEDEGRKKDIQLVRDVPRQALKAWTDRIAFGAVIDNIMSNALKYSKRGGTIVVRAFESNSEAVVAVSDAGPGIPDSEAALLFSRGGKLSARPTGGEASTGYGLAIAKDLTDALGGRIWFQNETSGATFFVAIPRFDPAIHFVV